jgi:hypothetical protein
MARSRNNALEFSSAGSVILTNSGDSGADQSFGAIQMLQDTTLGSTITSTNVTGTSLASKTFGAGTIIYGQFTQVTVSSGLVALHKV